MIILDAVIIIINMLDHKTPMFPSSVSWFLEIRKKRKRGAGWNSFRAGTKTPGSPLSTLHRTRLTNKC